MRSPVEHITDCPGWGAGPGRTLRRSVWTALLCGLVLVTGCRPSPPSKGPPGYRDSIAQWQAQRVTNVRKHWYSLAGLYWLEEGANTIGSDSTHDLVFPPKAPPHLGTLFYQDSTLRATFQPGVPVRHAGERVDSLRLRTDAGGGATKLTLGPLRWYVIERNGQLAVRLHDRSRAARLQASDLTYYPTDPAWRLKGTFVPRDSAKTIAVPNILQTTTRLSSPGTVTFEMNGQTHRLDVFEGGADTYFTLFADPTNRTTTYEAGRYLYVHREDSTRAVTIDFNKAYNPPCAFTSYATCPFPPAQNRLPFRVEAGEKRYSKPS